MVEKSKGGRPRKEIDFKQLDKLCWIQCTGEEVAAFFDVDYDTLNARLQEAGYKGFSDYYDRKKGLGKISLRRRQWRAAMSGDRTMLIWLGKQYLGQTDKSEFTGDGLVVNLIGPTEGKAHADDKC